MSIASQPDNGASTGADQLANDDRCYWDADCELGVHCEHFHGPGGRCCECGAVRR